MFSELHLAKHSRRDWQPDKLVLIAYAQLADVSTDASIQRDLDPDLTGSGI